jgi:hypothetical protein
MNREGYNGDSGRFFGDDRVVGDDGGVTLPNVAVNTRRMFRMTASQGNDFTLCSPVSLGGKKESFNHRDHRGHQKQEPKAES